MERWLKAEKKQRGRAVENEQRAGNRLRRVREAMGWNVEMLADALKISPALMEQIESGKRDVPHSRAIRVEAKLQLWETELHGGGTRDES